jgi:hypothetical protein
VVDKIRPWGDVMNAGRSALAMAVLLCGASVAHAVTVNVPGDAPTIQAGIDAAGAGDTVLVAPGTYNETINFQGKAITVESSGGADVTTIQSTSAQVATVVLGGSNAPVTFRGFTVLRTPPTAGMVSFFGGISATNSSGVIEKNVVTGHAACGAPGIEASGAIVVKNNVFWGNESQCTGGGIVAIAAISGGATLADNLVVSNHYGNSPVQMQGPATATRNVIAGNSALESGGAFLNGGTFSNNLVVGNFGLGVGGIFLDGLSPVVGEVTNNTFVDNEGGVYATGLHSRLGGTASYVVRNNVFDFAAGPLLNCMTAYSSTVPTFDSNNFISLDGLLAQTGSGCANPIGALGNISVDSGFVDYDAGDFHLLPTSPLVDAGSSTAAPNLDGDGDSRPLDGSAGLAGAQWDVGFDEAVEAGNGIQTTITGGPTGSLGTFTAPPFAFGSAVPGATFECDIDMAGFAPCASPVAIATDDERIYSFRVRARSGALVDRTPAMRLFSVDVTSPGTTVGAPEVDPGNWASWSIPFDSDERVSSFECSFDGAPFTACTSPLDLVVSQGQHTLSIRATDAAGNVDPTPATAAWTAAPESAAPTNPNPTTPTILPRPRLTPSAPRSFLPPPMAKPTAFHRLHLPGIATGNSRSGIALRARCDSNQQPTCQIRVVASARVTIAGTSQVVILGTALQTLAPGVTTSIRIRLNRKAKTLFKTRARLRVKLEGAIASNGGFATTATRTLFVNRAPR